LEAPIFVENEITFHPLNLTLNLTFTQFFMFQNLHPPPPPLVMVSFDEEGFGGAISLEEEVIVSFEDAGFGSRGGGGFGLLERVVSVGAISCGFDMYAPLGLTVAIYQ
jgi:hypothetical protein